MARRRPNGGPGLVGDARRLGVRRAEEGWRRPARELLRARSHDEQACELCPRNEGLAVFIVSRLTTIRTSTFPSSIDGRIALGLRPARHRTSMSFANQFRTRCDILRACNTFISTHDWSVLPALVGSSAAHRYDLRTALVRPAGSV